MKFQTLIAAAFAALCHAIADAQSYPSKPITIIVPVTAGSSTDGLARGIAQELTAQTGQSVVQGGGGSALDGKYERDTGGPSLSFTVTGGGRKIVNLTGSIAGYCVVYVPLGGGIRSEVRIMFPVIESMNVAADGSFSGTQKLSDNTTEITNGKLAGGIATGNVKVTSPGCTGGTQSFKSRRTGDR